jgi:hypothetical protein
VDQNDAGHGKLGDGTTASGTVERLDEVHQTGRALESERLRSGQTGADPDRLGENGGEDPGAALLRFARRYRISDAMRQRALAVFGSAAGETAPATGKAAAEGVTTGTNVAGDRMRRMTGD